MYDTRVYYTDPSVKLVKIKKMRFCWLSDENHKTSKTDENGVGQFILIKS